MYAPTSKIMIVDDSLAMRMVITQVLSQIGFTNVSQAVDGRDAYQQLEAAPENDPFSIVLSDLNMPECSGLELLQKIRAKPKYDRVAVIMVTSETDLGNVTAFAKAGATNVMMKPIKAEQLQAKLAISHARIFK